MHFLAVQAYLILVLDKICSMLDRPKEWLERIALQEFIERRKIVEKANSFGMKSKNSDSQSSMTLLSSLIFVNCNFESETDSLCELINLKLQDNKFVLCPPHC